MGSTFDERVFWETVGFHFFKRFWIFGEDDFGCFLRDFCEFVGILAWNRDGKCCQGPN